MLGMNMRSEKISVDGIALSETLSGGPRQQSHSYREAENDPGKGPVITRT
jgi:hypothetical protein